MKIENANVLLTGFKILSHAFINGSEQQKLIALDANNKLTLVDTTIEDITQYPRISMERWGGNIVNVISQGFNEKLVPVVITVKKDESPGFLNYLGNFEDENANLIFESDSTPMLIANPKDLNPLLVYSKGKFLHFGQITHENFTIVKTIEMENIPFGIHTSNYIDVSGNRNADLIFDLRGKNKLVSIFQIEHSNEELGFDLKELQVIAPKPDTIGPILFTELLSKSSPDMLFISKENGTFYLNVHRNNSFDNKQQESSNDIEALKRFYDNHISNTAFETTPSIKFDLKVVLEQEIPRLEDENGAPSGIFLADLSRNGKKDVFIIVNKISGEGSSILMLEYDPVNRIFVKNKAFADSQKDNLDFITAMTIFDNTVTGVEQLLINTSTYHISTNHISTDHISTDHISTPANSSVKLIDLKENLTKSSINILTLSKNSQDVESFIPGSSFILLYENEEKFIKTNLSFQSSFPSLQTHRAFIGLGQTHLFINNLSLKAPLLNNEQNKYDTVTFLVPNTFAIFTFSKMKWNLQSFFSKRYYRKTFIAVSVILFVFIAIYFILSIQDKCRYKSIMNNDKSVRRVLNAL
ncbi:hypothetical protein GINT2_001070 [Glugoides intestinalis]